MRIRKKLIIFGTSLLLCAVATTAPAMAGTARDHPGPSTVKPSKASAFIVHQGELTKFTTWIQETHKDIFNNGYLTTVYDASRLRITILWHGKETALLKALIAGGERRGIGVSVRYRRFGMKQLDDAAAYALHQAAKIPGFLINGVAALAANYDGIDIQAWYPRRTAAAIAMAKALPAVVTAHTGVTAKLTITPPAGLDTLRLSAAQVRQVRGRQVAASGPSGTRAQDYAPYSAGDFIYSPGYDGLGAVCSSNFGIAISGHGNHTLIARHCALDDYDVTNNDWEAYGYHADKLGSISGYSSNPGMAAWVSQPGYGSMFYGPYNTGNVVNIHGFADVGLNAYICTSGGNSGTHCNIQITNMAYVRTDGHGASVNTILANQVNGTIANMQGDSGGPIYQFDGTYYWAVGMIQGFAGAQLSSCGGANFPTFCFSQVWFSEIHTILNGISGASLLTR